MIIKKIKSIDEKLTYFIIKKEGSIILFLFLLQGVICYLASRKINICKEFLVGHHNLSLILIGLPMILLVYCMSKWKNNRNLQELKKHNELMEKVMQNSAPEDTSEKRLVHFRYAGWTYMNPDQLEDYRKLLDGKPLIKRNKKELDFLFLENKNK